MKKRLLTLALVNFSIFSSLVLSAHAQVSVLMHHNDVSRTGLNTNETLLTPANVNSNQFGKLFSQSVDGFVVAQPLYYPNLSIPGQGTHNVVYVVTQHDSVFAFDADNNQGTNSAPLWSRSFLANGVTTVPVIDTGCGNVTQFPEFGIMGTPVIDPSTGTLYLVAKTLSQGAQAFTLHALDITNGQEKFGAPMVITASALGMGGTVVGFVARYQLQRPGLLLSNGVVYVAFGSNGCDLYAHGWVMAYSASNVQQELGVFNTTPDSQASNEEGSIWQSGAGLAADSSGNIYVMTANGDFDADTGGHDFGDTFLKLTLGSGELTETDYFTPYNQQTMRNQDLDLGSSGPLLLPDQGGLSLLVGAGKLGTIYLVNSNSMGGYNPSGDTQIVQSLPGVLGGPLFGMPTYWNNMVYFAPNNTPLKAFSLSSGLLSTTPVLQSNKLGGVATPTISANGPSNGIVWMVRIPSSSSALLSAWNASTLGNEIYNSNQAGSRDTLGPVAHFVAPSVANGKAYVGTQTQLVVYGLRPAVSASAGNNQSGTVGTSLPVALQVLVSDPYSGTPFPGVSVTFSSNKGGSFSNVTATTDSSGMAATSYTLPQTAGTIAVTASSTGYASTQFSVTANPGLPANLTCGGGNQVATVGTALPAPLICNVKDSYGNLVPGAVVTFTDNGANGTLSATSVTTNSAGKVTVTYIAPTKSGSVKITVTVAGVTPLAVFEKAVAGSPVALSIFSGNNQTATAGTTLPKALLTSVVDQYSNPVPGVTVNFSDGGAGGTVSAPSVTTNGRGQASVTYTLPPSPGPVSVTATVNGLNPVVFSETAK